MARGRTQRAATVGVAEHGNSAVLVTVASGGRVPRSPSRIDLTGTVCRRTRITTKDRGRRGLGTSPARGRGRFQLADAVALVERVRESAADARRAREPGRRWPGDGAACRHRERCNSCLPWSFRRRPKRGSRILARRTFADSVMYREALATAAQARGWSVYWYDRERVFRDAAVALGCEDADAFLRAMGRSIGPPWQARHKLAAAAALAAAGPAG